MNIIDPYVEVPMVDGVQLLKNIEIAARVCYKSEGKITGDSYKEFISRLIKSGHHSTLEHEKVTVRVICDRGVSHEIVRHRLAAYSQESTRYCNYSNDKFGNEITFIRPFFFIPEGESEENCAKESHWLSAVSLAESHYLDLLHMGATPQEARSVLPNSLKTEIVVTYNMREWRHFFSLRAAKAAHPQMQQIAIPLLLWFRETFPVLFDDIGYNTGFHSKYYARIIEVQ